MTAPDPTYNLSAFADRLFAEKRLLPLANQIRRARDLHSLSTDLVMAMESIDALEAELTVPADPDDHRKLITESALLNNALVLYVRATKTESKERGGFDLRARFGDEEKVVHKELSDLRDSAIAHLAARQLRQERPSHSWAACRPAASRGALHQSCHCSLLARRGDYDQSRSFRSAAANVCS